MKISDIKAELDSYNVAYNDLFEKSEFVCRLRECRAEGRRPEGKGTDEGDYKDVETVKMGGEKKNGGTGGGAPSGGGMGDMLGNMGGMSGLGDIASMFGGMGGGGGASGGERAHL